MTEIWKDIEGYDGKYQVSNLGRVRSVDRIALVGGFNHNKTMLYRGKIRKQTLTTAGYLIVPMHKYPNISVHRAVAKAFVFGYFEGAQVNHKDENKQNNRAENLEWVTCKENINYGSHNQKCKFKKNLVQGHPVQQYTIDGKLIKTYETKNDAVRTLKTSHKTLCKAIETQSILKGYLFKLKTK